MRPCSTSTVASGIAMRRWIRPPAASSAPNKIGDRNDGERVVPGEEGHQDAGEAVAGDQRGVGLALDGGHLVEAGEAGAGAGDRAAGRRSACRRAGPAPARRRTLPPVMRAAKPKVVRDIRK